MIELQKMTQDYDGNPAEDATGAFYLASDVDALLAQREMHTVPMHCLFLLDFIVVQLVSMLAMIIGWILLIVPCAMRAWVEVEQIYQADWQVLQGLPKKKIKIWAWRWLNAIWGNDEDGVVSGLRGNVEYNPNGSRFKAYLWCAWRNSANNLRFVFRWVGGPFYRIEWQQPWPSFHKAWKFVTFDKVPWYFQAGWYPNGFPVISAGAI